MPIAPPFDRSPRDFSVGNPGSRSAPGNHPEAFGIQPESVRFAVTGNLALLSSGERLAMGPFENGRGLERLDPQLLGNEIGNFFSPNPIWPVSLRI